MQSIPLASILGICLCLSGCSGLDAPNRPEGFSTEYDRYKFVVEIPVVRPSKIGIPKVKQDAMTLVKKHQISNSVFYLVNGVPTLNKRGITHEGWKSYISATAAGRWYAEGWDFDSGTTAQIYLRYMPFSAGSDYVGAIVFVKDEKELGFRAIGGYRNRIDCYKDMAKLGYYIP